MSQKLAKSPARIASGSGQAFGVHVLFEGIDPIVDFVLVHGLDGHPKNTWTADNNVLWPRDILPKIIPNIRVLSWGYDARTAGAASSFSCQKLYDFGINLVTDLTLHRRDTETHNRPIIFLGHDIGGLIIKDALIHSNSANEKNLEHHNFIKTSTFGILFFGTPHQGSDILASSRSPFVSLKSVNDIISKNINEHSEYLQKQLRQYNHISSDFLTKCFYETYRGPSRKEVAVAISSATIPGAMDVEVFAVNSDHGEMVKYRSVDDGPFRTVSSCIKLMVDDAPKRISTNWEEWNRMKAAKMNGFGLTFEIPFEPEFRRNTNFTGRTDLLEEIHKEIGNPLAEQVMVVLYGTGGMGKTQIASEYAHAHRAEYQSIFWIDAASIESTQNGFRRAAQRLIDQHAKIGHDASPDYLLIAKNLDMIGAIDGNGVVSSHQDQASCIIKGVHRWLSNPENQRWLLIFDNFDDIDSSEIKDAIPKAPYGRIIMTSRRPESCQFGSGLPVGEMVEQEAEDLLLKSALLKQDDIARDLTRKLGSLPLAIVQAGAYVAVRQMSFAKYLEIYDKFFEAVAASKPPGWGDKERTVWTTWEISFSAIKETDGRAAELLSLCSFVSNENIRDDMVRRSFGFWKDVQRNGDYDTFYIHPVVHAWAHERLSKSERVRMTKETLRMVGHAVEIFELYKDLEAHIGDGAKRLDKMESVMLREWIGMVGGVVEHPKIQVKMNGISYVGKIFQHITMVAKHATKYLPVELLDIAERQRIRLIAAILHKSGESEYPVTLLSMAIEQCRDPNGCEALEISSDLAELYSHQGQDKKAEEILLQAVEKMGHINGDMSLPVYACFSKLASVYSSQGRHDEAEALQIRCVEGVQGILGEDDPKCLVAIGNLAATYAHQGRALEAEKLLLEVVEKENRIQGSRHPDTLCMKNNLATVYFVQGRLEEAEVLRVHLVEELRKVLGKSHELTQDAISILAEHYTRTGRLKEGEMLYLEVMETKRDILGNECPRTLDVMSSLAGNYVRQGRDEEAGEILLQVVEKTRHKLGNEHPDCLKLVRDLAETYARQGRYGEVEALVQEPLRIMKRVLGEEQDTLTETMRILANAYVYLGRHEEAEVLYLEILEANKRTTGYQHPRTLVGIIELAQNYDQQNRYGEMEALLLQHLEEIKANFGDNHPNTLETMRMIAKTYRHQGLTKEAKELELKLGKHSLDNEQLETFAATAMLPQRRQRGGTSHEESILEPEDNIVDLIAIADRLIADGPTATLDGDNSTTLESMSNLAASLGEKGQFKVQEKILLRIGEKLRKLHGEGTIVSYISSVPLASCYMSQHRYKEAEELLLPVIDTMQRFLGKDNERTLFVMELLADVYKEMGRTREAHELANRIENLDEETLQDAITMSLLQAASEERVDSDEETESEEHHPDRVKMMADEAATSWDLGDWGKAEKLESQVVNLRRVICGKESARAQTAMINLAATYRDQGRWRDAETLELQVMESRKRALGDRHPDTLAAMNNLAGTYTGQGRWMEAQALYLEVARVRSETLGKEDEKTLSAIAALATNHWHQGELEQAEKLEVRVVDARRRIFGNENPLTTTAIGNLAATYASQDRVNDAGKLQEEVFETLKRVKGQNHYETRLAKELLVLYRQQDSASRYTNQDILKPQRARERPQTEEPLENHRQGLVSSLSDIARKATTFSFVAPLFFCSFFISFTYACFVYLVRRLNFLPTLTVRIHNQEMMVQKWKEMVDGNEDQTEQ